MSLVTARNIERVDVEPGEVVRLEIPYSEVCMHMRVAGRVMDVLLTTSAAGYAKAQLLQDDGTPFSFPIAPEEAGIRRDYSVTDRPVGFYAYREVVDERTAPYFRERYAEATA